MKITIVTGAFFPVPAIMGGAVEKVWFALGQEFARRGHEVLHVSRAHSELPGSERIADVRHVRVPGFDQPRSIVWLKLLDLIYSLRVCRVLPEADILVTNTFWLPVVERRPSRGLIYVHVQRGPKGQMRSYAHVARLLAVSNAIADAIITQAPQLRDKVRVIPNPVPFKIVESNGARDETILFVGRIHPEKGIELLLEALAALRAEKFFNWKVKLIGPHETRLGGGGDEFLCAMQPLAEQSPIAVQWRGPIFDESELRADYRSAAIFVYPSIAETGDALPVAPLEAMANGCVPLVSALPVFRDYIEDGVNGFVFDHRGECGADNLLAKLNELLSLDRQARNKMADAARAKAAEFALEPVAQRYLDDFATLLAEARNPRSTSS
jgi:glycosyltransferase involved in cell wall biosynthesis